MKRSVSVALGITAAAILADQLSKWAFFALPETGVRLFPGLSLIRFMNPSLAGSIPAPEWILLPLAAGALAFCAVGLIKSIRHGNQLQSLGWAMIIGAGLSNLSDRIIRGGVLDIMRVGPISYINLADILIITGIIILLLKSRINSSKI